MNPVRHALTIAGSDSGGGAGIQADLKTFAAFGVFGTSAITAVTAQNTVGVARVAPLSADLVTAQIDAIVSDVRIDATKVGMIATAAIVEAVVAEVHGLNLPSYFSGAGLLPSRSSLILIMYNNRMSQCGFSMSRPVSIQGSHKCLLFPERSPLNRMKPDLSGQDLW